MIVRRPMKIGLGYIIGKNGQPRQFTRKQALAFMRARKSPLRESIVSDQGDYWRGSRCDQVDMGGTTSSGRMY